jgi:hypothetical protein
MLANWHDTKKKRRRRRMPDIVSDESEDKIDVQRMCWCKGQAGAAEEGR